MPPVYLTGGAGTQFDTKNILKPVLQIIYEE